jgi:hypothetical protein
VDAGGKQDGAAPGGSRRANSPVDGRSIDRGTVTDGAETPDVVDACADGDRAVRTNALSPGLIDNSSFTGALNESTFPYHDPYGRVPGIGIRGVPGVGIPVSPYFDRDIDKQVYDNLTLIRGNHSIRTGATDLLGIFNPNEVSLPVRAANPTAAVKSIRPYLGYNGSSAIGTEFNSNYNFLQISLNRRMSRGLNLGVA